MSTWQEDEELHQVYWDGYRARSINDCPYPKRDLRYAQWLRGWHKHRGDQHRVQLAAGETYCACNLIIRKF